MRIQKPIVIPYGDSGTMLIKACERYNKYPELIPMRWSDLAQGCQIGFRLGSY